MTKNNEPDSTKLSCEEYDELIIRVGNKSINDDDYKIIEDILNLNKWLQQQLSSAKLTIKKIKKFFNFTRETTTVKSIKDEASNNNPPVDTDVVIENKNKYRFTIYTDCETGKNFDGITISPYWKWRAANKYNYCIIYDEPSHFKIPLNVNPENVYYYSKTEFNVLDIKGVKTISDFSDFFSRFFGQTTPTESGCCCCFLTRPLRRTEEKGRKRYEEDVKNVNTQNTRRVKSRF